MEIFCRPPVNYRSHTCFPQSGACSLCIEHRLIENLSSAVDLKDESHDSNTEEPCRGLGFLYPRAFSFSIREMNETPEKDSYKRKERQTFMFACCENLNELIVFPQGYNLTHTDVRLFIHLCLEASNNAISVKINTSWLSSVFELSENTIHSSVMRLRYADLIRQREHSFMINPDYVRFGRKQIQALQRVNWAKLKAHSKAKTHSIQVIKEQKSCIHP